MTEDDYIPLEPETDPNLQANPHYWLYKVTREALDNPNHPLADMGHIWNRWACEGLSEVEAKEFGINLKDYPRLSANKKRAIENHIKDIEGFKEWVFPNVRSKIDFSDTTWNNHTNFVNFIFRQDIHFLCVTFKNNVHFMNAKFIKNVDFENATFIQNADFNNITFEQEVDFTCVNFKSNADFKHTKFTEDAIFENTTFEQKADFRYTSFYKDTNFKDTTFKEKSYFIDSKFQGNADFSLVTFYKDSSFLNANFEQNINFLYTEFWGNVIQFNECKFLKPTNADTEFDFKNTVFATTVNFSESEFHHLPNLTGVDFRGGINLDKVKFPSDFCHCESCKARRSNPEKNSQEQTNPRGLKLDCHSPLQGLRNDEEIKGGLSPKDAEITWHALSTEMEKAGYHDQSLKYFGYELDAKKLNPDTDGFFKVILSIYKNISDYGRSLARPFMAWCFLICAFFSIYSPIIFSNTKTLLPYYALKLSYKGAFPFVSDLTTFFDRMFTNADAVRHCPINTSLSHEPIAFNNTLELLIFPFLNGIHTLLSLILIFLFGLGVRNRLRLR